MLIVLGFIVLSYALVEIYGKSTSNKPEETNEVLKRNRDRASYDLAKSSFKWR